MAKPVPYPGPYIAKREHDSRNGWRGVSVYAEGGKIAIANMIADPFRDNEFETAKLIAEALNEHAARK